MHNGTGRVTDHEPEQQDDKTHIAAHQKSTVVLSARI